MKGKSLSDIEAKKVPLGFFPTPVVELKRLAETLDGPKLFIKRDDNTGLGLGGNKTRKLEYILSDALEQGADTIITAGAIQSNHCRQTAAAAASLGLECHLVLGGEQPNKSNGNLLLDQLFGCHIHWSGDNRKGEDIPNLVTQLTDLGKKVYVVPYGGSNELGSLAFLEAYKEIEAQSKSLSAPFTHIVFASSSGGTHSGLVLGKKMLNSATDIIGINIDKNGIDGTPLHEVILTLANATAQLLGLNRMVTEDDVILNSNYVGGGYGVIGALEKEAISLLARSEGILLDPVYTARAMGALIDMIRREEFSQNDRVLFWHTGGAPALFAYSDEIAPRP